ncbi:phosphotransferase [Micromonospora mirobrigensis]|uniref:Phosphotransferase enzyme family protein n=1 Tax=Micromonospora mirobrigensis TaxID=262898 RepID=A0A1C4YVM0_9ACTN|nr:phosphotransferase [Micromonospora mirobrigensis]SCF24401.1 Phosphotransferase enzyme family protein [Micromonospora mirobrigensis]
MIDAVAGTTPLASGRDADVYALGSGRVLRRYRRGGDVRAEAEVMVHLREMGYPVPLVHRADGPDLELQRLAGPTLLDALVAGDVAVDGAALMMADLHRRLHALPARRSADPGHRILHLDLHPANVMLTPDGPVVIDWRNTDEGPPPLDLATTALIAAEVAADPTEPLAHPAHDFLAAFLIEAGPVGSLDRAVELRAHAGPDAGARSARATALIRALEPQ